MERDTSLVTICLWPVVPKESLFTHVTTHYKLYNHLDGNISQMAIRVISTI